MDIYIMELYQSLPNVIKGIISNYCDKEDLEYYELMEYATRHELPIYEYKILKRMCFENKRRIFMEYYTDDIKGIRYEGFKGNDCKDLYIYHMKTYCNERIMDDNTRIECARIYATKFSGCNTFNYKKSSCECGLLDNVFGAFFYKFGKYSSIKEYNVIDDLSICEKYYDYYNWFRAKGITVFGNFITQ